ncbi:hypothetical protein M4R22_00435 [Acidovorax sp. GBBC 3334]|uniref:hypothetical protein n=1 Tax=Acidovorax sp. GBBC 3334 TaxID=2940496 RepID=UPI0023030C6D|nr:hypothetical protein [Acidovorax sp. GBBC 3334]MDA8453218.1 hypothetical protein [Acidovorax sp. GBBC 3334]
MTSSVSPPNPADATPSSAISLHDARPFFEKALVHGIEHGIVPPEKVDAIEADAPKGMVQVARYFGTEFLRPELEKARERMVNLVSLDLLEESAGDLGRAALLLREHSFLSRSKAGSDRLRRLIALPQNSNFGFLSTTGEPDVQQLSVWSLRSHAEYRAELARRTAIAGAIAAAMWFAEQFGLDETALEEGGADAEGVIRMGLLWHWMHPAAEHWPHAAAFEKRVATLRRKPAKGPQELDVPAGMPPELVPVVRPWVAPVQAEAARVLDPAAPLAPMVRPLGSFRARYFLVDDPLAELDEHYRSADVLLDESGDGETLAPASKTWERATQGHDDEHSLLTMFLCLAAGTPKKTVLTEKLAASLVRRVRKLGWQPERASEFILAHAAEGYRAAYLELWSAFVTEARVLLDDRDSGLHEAMALLRRECHVAG